ncbi:MAG: hypothetical protein DRI57_20410 [Deltaproteobacteria bacterium]|nr:MAG: hypothetical protein DRI57_20410 [Deltaproteobacteria bacterium]
MPVCRGLIRVHPCSSAVCESCFLRKKSRKTFGRVLIISDYNGFRGGYNFGNLHTEPYFAGLQADTPGNRCFP